VAGGAVDRDRLRDAIVADPDLLARVEADVHPLVAADREAFTAAHAGADVVVFDIPLLYETGAERGLDGVLVVTAPAEVQRDRVLARPGMTDAMLERILERQMPDSLKCARADFVVATDRGIDAARADVLSLLERIRAGQGDA
jgi:dephospho-CoA kinase